LALGAVLALWFFTGVYRDRESDSLYMFVKHRPSPHVYFYAPLGESDAPFSSLPPNQQKEEAAFRVFVESGRGYSRSMRIWN